MQACSISSFRSFFSCLHTLYQSVPASPCSVSALPLPLRLSPTLPRSLSPTVTPCNFFFLFQAWHPVLPILQSVFPRCLIKGVCHSVLVYVCVYLDRKRESQHAQTEVCACLCVCKMSVFCVLVQCCGHMHLYTGERERGRVCREGGGSKGVGGCWWWELTDRQRLWILHSMRIKATASPKVINLAAVLTATLLPYFINTTAPHIHHVPCYAPLLRTQPTTK